MGEGVEGQEGQAPGGVSGFAQGLMMKAMTAKEGLKEKAGVLQPGNLQAMGGQLMQTGMNLIPGRKEEEVPNPPEQKVENKFNILNKLLLARLCHVTTYNRNIKMLQQ